MSIRKQYDTDLESLKNSLTEMGRNSADAVENALEALCVADADAAAAIVKGDARINNMERDIEHRCMTLLLRQQPVAGDLRRISTAMKVVTDIERIGDHAADIAEIIPHLAEVAEGEVISQEPEAGNWEDPDNVNVVITVSTGDQEPSAQSDSADTAASSDAPAQTADNSAAAAAGEVWKCTQTLNTPSGYSGGPVRLELIQNVNVTPTASVVLEDQVIQFPYDLDITGAPGISEGTLYLSEQISGTYQELGNYSITFAKAE